MMNEKRNNKNQTKKVEVDDKNQTKKVEVDDKNQTKKTDKKIDKKGNNIRKGKIKKEKKEKKVEVDSVEKLLEKMTVDAVIDAMVEHKWLVAKTITAHIIGIDIFEKLSEEDRQTIIKRVNEIKMKTPGLM